jgi:C_GCAxxG_C_C family probable redox protein
MTKTEHAIQLFSEKHSCAQAVLMAFADDYGMDLLTASKVACAFGGGISHMGLTCGAVTGALLVLGLKFGGGPEMKEGTYQAVQEFVKRFRSLHGSINCTELVGYDLSDPEQIRKAREENVFAKLCVGYVMSAVKILEELP